MILSYRSGCKEIRQKHESEPLQIISGMGYSIEIDIEGR